MDQTESTAVAPPSKRVEHKFAICSVVRGRSNRTLRAAAPVHHRFTQFVLPQQYRLVRNRPVVISEQQLLDNIDELLAKHKQGILEVRLQAGHRLVDLEDVKRYVESRKEATEMGEEAAKNAPPSVEKIETPPTTQKAEELPAVETKPAIETASTEEMHVPESAIAPPDATSPQADPVTPVDESQFLGNDFIPAVEGEEREDGSGPEIPVEGAAADMPLPPEDDLDVGQAGAIPPALPPPLPVAAASSETPEGEYKEGSATKSGASSKPKKKGK